jgi:hypothetical protein
VANSKGAWRIHFSRITLDEKEKLQVIATNLIEDCILFTLPRTGSLNMNHHISFTDSSQVKIQRMHHDPIEVPNYSVEFNS